MIKMRYLKHGGVLLPDFKGKEARHCNLVSCDLRERRSEALRGGDPRWL